MIQSITFTNYLGNSIRLDLNDPEKSGFIVKSVSGLGPVNANISTCEYALTDGTFFNSARINQRNIVLGLLFYETTEESIEDIRHKSYRYFSVKKPITIIVETDKRAVQTTGYVESNEPDIFSSQEGAQISIICPDPYWYSTAPQYSYYSQIMGSFCFPFPKSDAAFPLGAYSEDEIVTIKNNGCETGLTIQIEVLDYTATPTIYNLYTGEYMQVRAELFKGDILTITTQTGNKRIALIRSGIESNYINRLVTGSTWLMLHEGDNAFHARDSAGYTNRFKVTFIHTNTYLGV